MKNITTRLRYEMSFLLNSYNIGSKLFSSNFMYYMLKNKMDSLFINEMRISLAVWNQIQNDVRVYH